MLIRPPQGPTKEPFRLTKPPGASHSFVTAIQLLFLFLVVRLVMVVSGISLIFIPYIDPLLGKLIAHMRVWFG